MVWLAKELAGLMSTDTSYNKKELISSLRQSCQRHLECVFNTFFEQASSTLLGLAENAETNRLQTLYVDAQRLVRGRRGEIETAVTQRVLTSISELEPTVVKAPTGVRENSLRNTPYSHFELLGNEDLEVMIALDNGTTAASETFKKSLYMLQRRFETLSEADVNKPMPMSPDATMEAFAEAVSDGMIAVEVQVVLINDFNQICFNRDYGKLLDWTNEFLETAGVLPAPDPSAPDQPQANVEVKSGANSRSIGQAIDSIQPDVPHASTEHRIQALVDKRSPKDSSPAAPANVEPNNIHSAEPTTTRIQTELLARISSILESTGQRLADEDARFLGRQQVVAQID